MVQCQLRRARQQVPAVAVRCIFSPTWTMLQAASCSQHTAHVQLEVPDH